MYKSLPLILLLFFSFPAILFGQSDYVLTVKGDSLKGKVTFQQIGKVEQVQIKGTKRQTISSIQIREATMRGKLYRPVQYAGSVQMMEVLTDGYLSLLAFKPLNVMNYDGRLLHLRDGRMMEVPSLTFKKQMSNFLVDDDSLVAHIQDGSLGRKDLDEIITEYNLFVDNKTHTSREENKNIEKVATKIELLDGIKAEVAGSTLESKKDILEMLTELKAKVSDNKSIPQYLINGLKENLQSKPALIEKLEELLKQ